MLSLGSALGGGEKLPPTGVPTSLSLCGELKHMTACLGTYLLTPQRTANGKPVWKHASEDRWIAFGSVDKWMVQRGENVGSNLSYMTLQDTTASLPHQSTGVWEEADGKQLVKAPPSCKCFGDVPTSLSLCGELKVKTTCLGIYLLAPQSTANEKPVWKHATEDRWIAFGSVGKWMVQFCEEHVGVNNIAFMQLQGATASLPHQSTAVWEELYGEEWVKAPSCKCFGDVPTSLSLCGELKHKISCPGTYLLALQRTAHGKPVWKHATEDRWIALSSTGKWIVQEGEDVGVNGSAFMILQDTTASLPHQSTAVWEEVDGTEKLVKVPTCKCFGDVPTSLSLCGELKHMTTCLGTYLLAPQRTANGKPVWKHATEDKWIAFGSVGKWMVQEGANVSSDLSYMRLEDTKATLPHQSTGVWEELDGKSWQKAPTCKCFGDVPTSLSLCGELKHMTTCLGTYLLALQRTAHGKPVWKHATDDRWIALSSVEKWMVQEGVDVGVASACYMTLQDTSASRPHQSTAVWEESDGKQLVKAPPIFKCFGDVPTSLSLCGELKHKISCMGTYLLALQRTAHGKPVWKHATEDRWIAFGSTGKWMVQMDEDVGVNNVAVVILEEDTKASLPHQSTGVWEEYDGTAKQWVKVPTCKCFGDVPTSLSLCGELKHKISCPGTYLLALQRTAHGKPVWKHATEDRWIAFGSTGKWMVQFCEEHVGVNNIAFMQLQGATASLPHQSAAVWEEHDSTAKQWVKAPTCKCFGDVPTSLSLCGELKVKTACLGIYLLAPQRTANGKPVWKHATEDRWIALSSTGKWMVQEGEDVGVNGSAFMILQDTTASLPHQSTADWEVYDGTAKQWVKGAICKAENMLTVKSAEKAAAEKAVAAKKAADENAAAEKAAAEKAAAEKAAAEKASKSMLRRAMTWIGLPGAQKVRVEENAHRALDEDGFALRPLLASDASVLRSLEALLETEHPEWLGKGKDVSKKYGPYDSLKLACAWKVDHPRNLDKYTAGVKRVQKEMDLLKKKGKDVDKVPGLPVRTARAAEGFTMKAGSNEAILLHGTSPDRLLALLSTGLNERYSGTNAGTAFGDGVYLAEDVGKTDQYVGADSAYDPSSDLHKRLYGKTVRHPGDVFYVLVVRAALGFPVRTQKMGQKATSMDNLTPIFPIGFRELSPVPGVTPPIVHHSLIAELGAAIARYREFVLFHSEYVHIDYVIAYHRCDGGQKLSTTDNPLMA